MKYVFLILFFTFNSVSQYANNYNGYYSSMLGQSNYYPGGYNQGFPNSNTYGYQYQDQNAFHPTWSGYPYMPIPSSGSSMFMGALPFLTAGFFNRSFSQCASTSCKEAKEYHELLSLKPVGGNKTTYRFHKFYYEEPEPTPKPIKKPPKPDPVVPLPPEVTEPDPVIPPPPEVTEPDPVIPPPPPTIIDPKPVIVIPPKDEGLHRLARGARKTLATYYQSCDAINTFYQSKKLIPLEGISTKDENGKYLTFTSKKTDNPDSTQNPFNFALFRRVTDLACLDKTHPYWNPGLENQCVARSDEASTEAQAICPDGQCQTQTSPIPERLPLKVSSQSECLSLLKEDENKCIDISQTPPIFNFGGKIQLTKGSMSLYDCPQFENYPTKLGSQIPSIGLDCSGFIDAALRTSGLKLTKTYDIKTSQKMNIDELNNLSEDPSSCIEKIKINDAYSVKSGDMILFSNGSGKDKAVHGMVIEEVKDGDPFGFYKKIQNGEIKSSSDCTQKSFSHSDFNFNVIHSQGNSSPDLHSGIGVSKTKISDYLGNQKPNGTLIRETIFNKLRIIAELSCQKHFNPELSIENTFNSSFSIVRFKKDREENILKECRQDDQDYLSIKGAECSKIESCLNNDSNNPYSNAER